MKNNNERFNKYLPDSHLHQVLSLNSFLDQEYFLTEKNEMSNKKNDQITVEDVQQLSVVEQIIIIRLSAE